MLGMTLKFSSDTSPIESGVGVACMTEVAGAPWQRSFQERLPLLLGSLGEAAYAWNILDDTIEWTPGAAFLFGLRDSSLLATGEAYARLVDPEAMVARHITVFEGTKPDHGDGVRYEITYPLRIVRDGVACRIWVEDIGHWYAGADHKPCHAEGIVRVVTERLEAEQRRAVLSRSDPLTGTLDRTRILEILEETLNEAKRIQSSCGLILVSMEGIGAINDAYGIEVADQMIDGVAKRIRSRMRSGDAIGRYSTTTFVIVLANCKATDLEIAMRRFYEAVREAPISTMSGPIAAQVALGGAIAPRYGRTAAEWMIKTREALMEARQKRSGGCSIYLPDPQREERRRLDMTLTQDLISALNDRRITLTCTPVMRADGTVAWQTAVAQIETPSGPEKIDRYIKPAERLGVVSMLDRRVLELAFTALDQMPDERLAIAISCSTLADQEWRDLVGGLSALIPGAGRRLLVSVPEVAVADAALQGASFITDIREAGIRTILDDFGTGHASLKILREIGIDLVRMSNRHVKAIATSLEDRAFVQAMLALARDTGFETLAEAGEDEQIAGLLSQMGVDYLQVKDTRAGNIRAGHSKTARFMTA